MVGEGSMPFAGPRTALGGIRGPQAPYPPGTSREAILGDFQRQRLEKDPQGLRGVAGFPAAAAGKEKTPRVTQGCAALGVGCRLG